MTTINNRFNSIDKRFESITNLMVAMFGSVMALIIALVGYMVWDRRTAQKLLREKMADLEDHSRQVNRHLDINNPAGSVTDRLVALSGNLPKPMRKWQRCCVPFPCCDLNSPISTILSAIAAIIGWQQWFMAVHNFPWIQTGSSYLSETSQNSPE